MKQQTLSRFSKSGLLKLLYALSLVLASGAQAFNWRLDQTGDVNGAELQGALLVLEQELQNGLGDVLLNGNSWRELPVDFGSEEFLDNFTRALSASQASEAVDYASNFRHLSASTSLTLGYRQGQSSLLDVLEGDSGLGSIGAISAQYGASFAFRFHNQDRSRYSFGFSGASFSEVELNYEAQGYSVGWQYDLVKSRALAGPLSEWKNLRFGLGLRFNSASFEYRNTLGKANIRTSDLGLNSQELSGLELALEPSFYLKQYSRAWTLPVELSTTIQFFRFLSFYGLAALDLSWGRAEGSTWLESPVGVSGASVTAQLNSSLNLNGGENVDIRTRIWEFRTLIGSQFDLGNGAVFFQYQSLLRGKAHSAAIGFRAFF